MHLALVLLVLSQNASPAPVVAPASALGPGPVVAPAPARSTVPAADGALLQLCRQSHASFQAASTVTACEAAGAARSLAVAERIEALRLLADALVLEGKEDDAANALVAMLVLDGDAALAADAGPRLRKALRKARHTLDTTGRIRVAHVLRPGDAPGAPRVLVQLNDPLGRVAGVRVRVKDGDRLAERALVQDASAATTTWTGPLPRLYDQSAKVDYQIVLDGWTGRTLPVDADLLGTAVTSTPSPAQPGWRYLGGAVGAGLMGCGGCSTITAAPFLATDLADGNVGEFTLVMGVAGLALVVAGAGLLAAAAWPETAGAP